MLTPEKRQHRAYALRRVNMAVTRLVLASTPAEKTKAGQWARRWSKAAGNLYYLYFGTPRKAG